MIPVGVINQIKKGENLLHPRLSAGWIIAAIVGVFILGGIVLFTLWGWGQVSNAAQNVPVVGSVTAPARVYAS